MAIWEGTLALGRWINDGCLERVSDTRHERFWVVLVFQRRGGGELLRGRVLCCGVRCALRIMQ